MARLLEDLRYSITSGVLLEDASELNNGIRATMATMARLGTVDVSKCQKGRVMGGTETEMFRRRRVANIKKRASETGAFLDSAASTLCRY